MLLLAGCGGRSELEVFLPCFDPVADCNGEPFDGCEVNLTSDSDNCGACGHRCPAGLACGDGRCVPPETPVQVESNGGANLFRTAGGGLFGWGYNPTSALLLDVERQLAVVEIEGLPPLAEIRMSLANACGRSFDGRIWCWGDGYVPGRSEDAGFAPAPVVGIEQAVRLTSSYLGYCALEARGDWKCWGYQPGGELSIVAGETVDENFAPATTMRALPGFARDLVLGLAVLADGSVWAWGEPENAGILPIPNVWIPPVDPPVRLSFVADAAEVHAWLRVFCARPASEGPVVCWGSMSDPGGVHSQVPFQAFPPGNYKEIAPSPYHLCALRGDGRLLCPEGQENLELDGVADIASHERELLVVTRDGRVLCVDVHHEGNCATGELGFVYDYVEVDVPLPADGP